MDVQAGFAPRALTSALIAQRSLVPEDSDAIDRLFHYLESALPTMAEIRQAVCEFYDVSRQDLESQNRAAHIVFARHVFCYFAHKYARASLHRIKQYIRYLDHSSVHHGVHRIERYSVTRPLVRDDLDLIRLRICEKLLARKATQC
jgi:chromosomal replication initiation ATPase DnaA